MGTLLQDRPLGGEDWTVYRGTVPDLAANVPFKANQDRCYSEAAAQSDEWAAYDIASRQRGSLTVWFTEAAIAAWKAEPRCTRGGQPRYSALAIATALTPRAEPGRCRPRRWRSCTSGRFAGGM